MKLTDDLTTSRRMDAAGVWIIIAGGLSLMSIAASVFYILWRF
jgi:hypothetical protein